MADAPSQEELEAADCWEADDQVPGRTAMTELRRTLRYHQAQWREAKGHPIGSQPIAASRGKPSRPVGSRLPLDYARETGATFLSPGALAAARARTSSIEPHQSFDHQRLWADLLWSPTMAFNLFGDLAADLERADRALQAWWPDAPGTASEVRRSLTGALRSRLPQQPPRVRRRVRARSRRVASDRRGRRQVPRTHEG